MSKKLVNETAAVVYARYSAGPKQTDQSIEGQVYDCQEYAEAARSYNRRVLY